MDTPGPQRGSERQADQRRMLKRATRWPVILGAGLMLVWFGGFGGWAALAPLASAAIAPGVVSPDGNRRTVQHLEGGIIEAILVREGAVVEAGQPLVILDEIGARAVRDRLRVERWALLALQARLIAERDRADRVMFPESMLADAEDPRVSEIMADQTGQFAQRRQAREGQRSILRQRIAQLVEEIHGLEAEIRSQATQFDLIGQEIASVEHLVGRGLERMPRLLALQRAQAEIEGTRASNQAAIARARQAIGEAELQILMIDSNHLSEVAEALGAARGELLGLEERLRASDDILRRTAILAPVAGTVVELRYHTAGGVIGPGQAILDIVPVDDDLLIDAEVSPTDIDVVRPGLPAQIHLTAYRQRTLPRIDGRVHDVSADRLTDEHTGRPYYRARIEVDRASLRAIAPDIDLLPGMPAEVLILSGERTTLAYLLDPLFNGLRRSLREN